MSEEQNNFDQNGLQQTEGMDTQESQGGEGTENEDERKIFVGGLGWDTTQKELQEYMENFGAVSSCALKTDMETRKSRGFGFVVFKDASSIDKVLAQSEHKIKDRKIDPKRANPRGDRESKENKKKIFVGKVDPSTTEETLRTYFEQFGMVEKVELPFDKMKDMRRNFVFVEFDKEETVTKILSQENHKIGDEEVDIKKVTPPNNPRGRGRGFGFRGGDRGRGGRGGGWNYGGGGGGWGNQGGWGQQGYNQGYGGYNQGGYGGGYNPGYNQGYNYGYDQSGYGYGGYGGGWGGYDQSGYGGYSGYGNGYGGGYDYSGWGGYDQSGQQMGNYGKAPKGGRGGGGYRPY